MFLEVSQILRSNKLEKFEFKNNCDLETYRKSWKNNVILSPQTLKPVYLSINTSAKLSSKLSYCKVGKAKARFGCFTIAGFFSTQTS